MKGHQGAEFGDSGQVPDKRQKPVDYCSRPHTGARTITSILVLVNALGSTWSTPHTENGLHNPNSYHWGLGYGHHLPPPQVVFNFQVRHGNSGVGLIF